MNKPRFEIGKREERNLVGAELRVAAGDEMALVGRCVSYRQISSNELAPGVRERVLPGAFRDTLADSSADVKALVNHNPSLLLGRRKNNTLQLQDSEVSGLYVRILLNPQSSYHRDVWQSVKRGDMADMSFAFVVPDGGDSYDEDDFEDERGQRTRCMVRSISRATLLDCSAVTQPFYGAGATSLAARSLDEARNLKRPLVAYRAGISLQSTAEQLDYLEKVGREIREQAARDAAEAERIVREQRTHDEETRRSMRLYRPERW